MKELVVAFLVSFVGWVVLGSYCKRLLESDNRSAVIFGLIVFLVWACMMACWIASAFGIVYAAIMGVC